MINLTYNEKKGYLNHKWHLVNSSWLPLGLSIILFNFVLCNLFFLYAPTININDYIYYAINRNYSCLTLILLNLIIIYWVCVVLRESSQGYHTVGVLRGLRFGMLLFIISEVMFFFSFFWAYFHSSLIPSIYLGSYWPPIGLQSIDFFGLPFTNTILLLSSGLTLTLAHMALISKVFKDVYLFEIGLGMTLDFGITFLICQTIEYVYGLYFRINENIYSTIFFLLTGFHGFHVTLGTVFLLFCYIRGTFKMEVMDLVIHLTFIEKIILFSESLDIKFCTKFYDMLRSIIIVFRFEFFLHLFNFLKKFKNLVIVPSKNYAAVDLDVSLYKPKHYISFCYGYLPRWRYTIKKHVGFETVAWYWHFVDVVWIFLYLTVYWLFI